MLHWVVYDGMGLLFPSGKYKEALFFANAALTQNPHHIPALQIMALLQEATTDVASPAPCQSADSTQEPIGSN